MEEKEKAFEEVLAEMLQTFLKKNHDYGNSFSKTFSEFGLVSAVVRMNDKMERLKSLLQAQAKVDESVRDTLMDLANYSVMTIMELAKEMFNN